VREDNGIKVTTFYKQYPHTYDENEKTFEDELWYEVEEGLVQAIKGGRTRTRLLYPEEFKRLAFESGFGMHGLSVTSI